MAVRTKLRRVADRIHAWLGWIVGLQILAWTASGLFMVCWPIEQIRGEHLRRAQPLALTAGQLTAPMLDSRARAVKSVTLEMQLGRPIWAIRYTDGGGRAADGATGRFLPPVDAARAAALARADYLGAAALTGVARVDPDHIPLDLRRSEPAWAVRFADDTNLYVDAETGQLLARRTALWRAYDFMWGLHIMDWRGREDSSHPLLIGAAILSLVSIVAGLVLLPLTIRRKRQRARLNSAD